MSDGPLSGEATKRRADLVAASGRKKR